MLVASGFWIIILLPTWILGGGLMVVAPEVGRKIIAIKPVSKTFIEQLQLNNHYLQEFSILTFAQKPRVA